MNGESDGSESLSDQFYDIVDVDGDDNNDSGAVCPLIANDSQSTLVGSV